MPFNNNMFGFMFTIFPIFFILIFGIILFTFFMRFKEWNSNNRQPVLTVPAKVVSKRSQVSHGVHNTGSGMSHHHSHTSYYVTFEVESGDRMELHISAQEFGLLAEGDVGRLTFQGTRYHSFDRYKE